MAKDFLNSNSTYPKFMLTSSLQELSSAVDAGLLRVALIWDDYHPRANDIFFDADFNVPGSPETHGAISSSWVAADMVLTDAFFSSSYKGVWPNKLRGHVLTASATVFTAVAADPDPLRRVKTIVLYREQQDAPEKDDILIGQFRQDTLGCADIEPDGDNITINWDWSGGENKIFEWTWSMNSWENCS